MLARRSQHFSSPLCSIVIGKIRSWHFSGATEIVNRRKWEVSSFHEVVALLHSLFSFLLFPLLKELSDLCNSLSIWWLIQLLRRHYESFLPAQIHSALARVFEAIPRNVFESEAGGRVVRVRISREATDIGEMSSLRRGNGDLGCFRFSNHWDTAFAK